ncbi:hypothetical protein V6N13_003034 [Hibiscus sabdariffa]
MVPFGDKMDKHYETINLQFSFQILSSSIVLKDLEFSDTRRGCPTTTRGDNLPSEHSLTINRPSSNSPLLISAACALSSQSRVFVIRTLILVGLDVESEFFRLSISFTINIDLPNQFPIPLFPISLSINRVSYM